MPLYEYECTACGHRFETIQKFSDPPLETCPKCGGTVRKLQSAPAFQFKGSGWYVTDYARKGQGPDRGEAPGKSDKSESSGGKSDKSDSADKTDKGETKSASAESSGGNTAPAAAPAAAPASGTSGTKSST